MNQPHYFKPWLGNNKLVIGLFLLLVLLCAFFSFGLFVLNQQYVIGYFGAQPEDISLSVQLAYVGVITMLTIQFRFQAFFQRRAYLIVVILAGMVLSVANYYNTDLFTFMVLRVFTGFQAVSMAGCMLTLFIALLPPPTTMIVASTLFYGSILGNSTIIGLFSDWLTDHMDWQNIYRYLFLFQAACLGIALVLLNRESGQKRYPLYQIDWTSAIFWVTGGTSLAYTVVYGPKYYWFSDDRIVTSALVAIGTLLLLFCRQPRLKRPYWHSDVFKNGNLVAGFILLFIYYTVKDSINLIYAYCFGIVHWDTFHVMLLGSLNLAGTVCFMLIALWLLLKKIMSFRLFFIAGFGLLLAYHLWMYYIFTPDLSFGDLLLPVFLQGAASGSLFVPIILYSVSGLPAYTGFTGITIAAVTRFLSALLSITGFYLLQLYFNQLNKESFLSHITQLDPAFTGQLNQYTQLFRSRGVASGQADALASANISRSLSVQGQLLTDRHVFMVMALIIIVTLIGIGIAPLIRNIYQLMRSLPENHEKRQ